MVEREIRTKEELLEFLYELKEAEHINVFDLEERSGIGHGIISRWKRHAPNFISVLKVLSTLDAKMVICTDHLEEKWPENKKTAMLELDRMILGTAKEALKKCNSLSDKKRLYKVLQAFL